MKTVTLFTLDKPKLIDLMEKDYATTKIHKKSSMESSRMVSWREWENYTSQVEITT